MKVETASRRLVSEFRSQPTLRAGSLITTVFGDAIAPRGGGIWLGSLISLMEPFGINERLVRTSVFRLVRDGWLQSEQIGRRSYYSLSDDGRTRFEQATQRIYGMPGQDWDGHWCLLLLSALDTPGKEAVRKECGWLGFAAMSANLLAHPSPNLADLDQTIDRLGVSDSLVALSGQTIRNDSGMQVLAQESWNLVELDNRYRSFVKRFRPLMAALQQHSNIDGKTAFLTRTLLIQEYRKIMLRDPLLPQELLPGGWHGKAAYLLCSNLYRAVHAAADEFLSDNVETADGPLPGHEAAFAMRFGGLGKVTRRKVI